MKVLMFIFGIFLIPSVFAVPTTGPITPDVILHFHPELNALGTAYRVPVVVGGVTGVAEVAAKRTVGALLGDMVAGLLGPWGIAAITAAQLCYEQTSWKICHSTIDPIVPITIDTSKITAATLSPLYVSSATKASYTSISSACIADATWLSAQPAWSGYTFTFTGTFTNSSPIQCQETRVQTSNGVSTTGYYWTQGVVQSGTSYTCPSGSSLTNSSGAPMAVTGQSCTPDSAYSCPTNYSRSDAYGNLSNTSMFCSYQSPALTDDQTTAQMKAVLLQYYADQLFKKADGTTDNSPFQQSDTTFDPSATPSSMPMTWDQLKQYVDWIRNGTAQTTDPLAPHYISPNNYDYTKTYITNNNTATTTNNSTSTSSNTITPSQAASAAQGLTQSQYEDSNKKTDDKLKTDIAAIPQPAVTGLLTPIDDFTTSVNDIKTAQVPTINKPSTISYGSGTCWSPTIDSLNGSKINAGVYCDNYSQIAHPILYWSIWAGTFIYLWHFGRQTVSARV